jgi:hypothetical protein
MKVLIGLAFGIGLLALLLQPKTIRVPVVIAVWGLTILVPIGAAGLIALVRDKNRVGDIPRIADRIRNPPKRVVAEVCFVALAWLLAGIAYLLDRHAATSPLLWAGLLVVWAELAYDINTYASDFVGGRAVTPLGRFTNRLSFVLLWPAALVIFAFGAFVLITGQHF